MTDPGLSPLVDGLKQQVDEHGFIDVGEKVEWNLPVSRTEFNLALDMLKDEGYQVHFMRLQHVNNSREVYFKVLVGPGVTQQDTYSNRDKIRLADFTQQ